MRVTNAGYTWSSIAENIAAGTHSPAGVIQQWLNSPGHCANIMNPAYVHMGVAYAVPSTADYSIYWTQLFAAPW